MIEKIGVVGAGQMGAGIAQVAAMNGFFVILNDIEDAFLHGAIGRIQKSLSHLLEKGRISETQRTATLMLIRLFVTTATRPIRISTLKPALGFGGGGGNIG